VAVVLGSEATEHVTIQLLRRSHPTATDFWDGNWIESVIQVTAGGFRGEYNASLRSDEFQRFQSQLRALETTLKGTATLSTLEEQVRLDLDADGKGHLAVRGVAFDEAGTGNALQFHFELDQTYLTGLLRRLDEALAAFPVLGQPG